MEKASKPTSSRTGLCAFPGCGGWSKGSKFGLCRKHEDEMKFLMWMLENIKVAEAEDKKVRPSGLVLP